MREVSGSADLFSRPVSAAAPPLWRRVTCSVMAIAAGVGTGLSPGLLGGPADQVLLGVIALILAASLAFLVWHANPAWTLTAALVLSPLASNWPQLGIPGALSPNRLLLIAGIGAVLLRAPGTRGWPRRLIVTHVHWVLVAAIVYAVVSAAVAGTLYDKAAFFRLFDVFGVLPFLVFVVAPIAFRSVRNRAVLLGGLVGLGAYLGLMALLETAGPRALVYPRFILSAGSSTDHRAMGIFLDPVMNGTGMFVCGVAAAIALTQWRRPSARLLAGATILLCAAGALFTLERSVWLGALVGAAIGALAAPRLRRLMLPLALAGTIIIGGSLLLVPRLSDHVQERANERATIWDRQNLAIAANNMIVARPLLGFGWSTFERSSLEYFRQSPDFPLNPNLGFSTTTQGTFSIHNEFLAYAATLGLLGTALWLAGIALGVMGALRVPRSPSLEPWRLALVSVVAFYAVISSFVPPLLFPNLVLWFWIGVVWSAYYNPIDSSGLAKPGRPPR